MDFIEQIKKKSSENIFSIENNCVTSRNEVDSFGNLSFTHYLMFDVNSDRVYLHIDKNEIGHHKSFYHKSIEYTLTVSNSECESRFLNDYDYNQPLRSKRQENPEYVSYETKYFYKGKFILN